MTLSRDQQYALASALRRLQSRLSNGHFEDAAGFYEALDAETRKVTDRCAVRGPFTVQHEEWRVA